MLQRISLLGGLLFSALVGWATWYGGLGAPASWTAATIALCAVWWVFEPVPIPVTSLVPLAILPLVGVLSPGDIGQSYGSPLVLLMMGGFMLSVAMEKSNTHRRIALTMVRRFGGGSPRGLVFGFMLTSAALSMWISNAATTLMLLPIAMAVVDKVTDAPLRVSLLLGVAYAASIGGVGTPIGTPPNLVFMNEYRSAVGAEPTFIEWMKWAFPISVIMIPLAAFWLTRNVQTKSVIELPDVGPWRTEEVRTLSVFAITALLWMTRRDPWGGWSGLLSLEQANDASVALLAVVAMHLLPNGNTDEEGKPQTLLDWKSAVQIPWGILILYGGGIAIAKAFTQSGLSDSVGAALASLGGIPVLLMIAVICLMVTFLTEVTSNTATATLLMPVLATAAISSEIDPKLIMVPATISCSFAFMLPVATPPNAIVFGSEQLSIKTMAREGLALNLLGVIIVTLLCWWMFGG